MDVQTRLRVRSASTTDQRASKSPDRGTLWLVQRLLSSCPSTKLRFRWRSILSSFVGGVQTGEIIGRISGAKLATARSFIPEFLPTTPFDEELGISCKPRSVLLAS